MGDARPAGAATRCRCPACRRTPGSHRNATRRAADTPAIARTRLRGCRGREARRLCVRGSRVGFAMTTFLISGRPTRSSRIGLPRRVTRVSEIAAIRVAPLNSLTICAIGISTTIARTSRNPTVFAAVSKDSLPEISVRIAASTSMKKGSLTRPAKTRIPSCSSGTTGDESRASPIRCDDGSVLRRAAIRNITESDVDRVFRGARG